ncbi:(R)-mandelonitrile lyase-like [Cucurbita pepo subsp. pepo]|uniref:(R)-mandelonitrile lyase-like n=1 Tax=Cucurbita pepo subsp. pepo TaxID=3664 RepID=UPI000C9D72E9|nr:(R)-mandelonitrile lyase-like [Cucurbita pepo subsp. pepo]
MPLFPSKKLTQTFVFSTMPPRIFSYSQILAFLLLFYASPASISADLSSSQREPSYLKFVSDAADFPKEDYYDYIIVGGGTAGCPLAATLSSKFRVLVLERGGVPHGNSNLMSQEGFLTTLMDDVHSRDSPVQAFTSEEGIPNARGRILGGSSAINAGFYSRADPAFFQNSHLHWDLAMVNQSYEWVEKEIVFRPNLKNWQSAVRDGMVEAGIKPYHGFSFDHLIGTKIGGSTFDELGRRHSAADLLAYAKPCNIKVAVHATVERILVASKATATGVLYHDQRGAYHHALLRARGEVLVAAGAIGSPHLLLLSGIGSRPYLSSWGIPVTHHLPYVGHYLYDNPRNGISILSPMPLEQSLIQVAGITESGAYLEATSNVIPFTSPPKSFFIRAQSAPVYLTVATLMEKIIGPVSFGSMRLASTDVRVNPVVWFNYFGNAVDLERCVNGTRKIGEVLRSRSMEGFKFSGWLWKREFRFVGPVYPEKEEKDDGFLREFCKRTVSTIWHYHGGCVAGKVVDRNHRVIGMEALRVVDGSTFGVSPGTNPQATLMMLGRHVGLQIIKERSSTTTHRVQ